MLPAVLKYTPKKAIFQVYPVLKTNIIAKTSKKLAYCLFQCTKR